MLKTFKYRIYPNGMQEEVLNQTLSACRFAYNHLLGTKIKEYKENHKSLSRFDMNRLLVSLKEEHPELKEVYSQVLQDVSNRISKAYDNFFRRVRNGEKPGFPRFKSSKRYKSFTYPQGGFFIINNKLRLSKIGDIKIIQHRPIEGKIKTLNIKRSPSGKWYATFSIENESHSLPKTGKAVGIDVGLKHFLTDTDGRQVENPTYYEKSLKRLRKRHRSLSRKKKGSNNREKAGIRLARSYEKLTNQRDDFLHKISRFYVNNYDFIAAEDLNIDNMIKNRFFGGKILDSSWGKFLHMTDYKAVSAGRTFVKVNPRGTSQEYNHGKLDRDYNAAINILERGLLGQQGPSEFTPVEIGPLSRVTSSEVVTGQVLSMNQEATCASKR